MKVIDTKFKGLKIIQHKKNGDSRGNLRETYRKKIIKWDDLIFDYATTSKKNVLRGFHFQTKFLQAKYVSVLKGKILDYVIDLRKKSKTFGKSFFIELSDSNCKALYIPEGFAHAYYSFSELNIIYYKPSFENGIIYDDKDLKIKWPKKRMLISKKDKNLNSFNYFCNTIGGL